MPQGDALQSPYPFKGTTFSESTLGNKKSTRNLKEWVSRTYSPRRQHLQSKRRPLGCLLLSEGGLLFPPPMNPISQPLGKADLEDLFSGVVSTELGPSLEPQTHRGRLRYSDKNLWVFS